MLNLPFRVKTNHDWYVQNQEIIDMRKWLKENIGEPYKFWATDSVDLKLCVKFKNEKDAILFALRWS